MVFVVHYASQSSSSVVAVCGAGSGGMTSDILANAPEGPAGASPDSPPAGPLPDIPGQRIEDIMQIQSLISVFSISFDIKRASNLFVA